MNLVHLESLSSILGVLTSLIAPAVLISACASLIISTANRMALTTERVRLLAHELRQVDGDEEARTPARCAHLEHQMEWAFRRAVAQQRALTLFYSATAFLVACSFALGLEALTQILPNWLPVALGLCGVLLLLLACALLLVDARLLITGMRDEMAELRRESRRASSPRGTS